MKRWFVWIILGILLISGVTIAESAYDTTNIIFHFHGTDTSSQIGQTVRTIGDINNDGFDDIVITSRSPEGTYVFFGGNPVDTIPDMFLRGHHVVSEPGDFTGDGINDILISDISKNTVYLYRGFIDSLESVPYDSLAPVDSVYDFGGLAVGYVNNDNIMDVLIRDGNYPGGGKVYYYENPFVDDKVADWTYSITDYRNNITHKGFIDYNGDNFLDIFFGLRAGQTGVPGYLYFYYGPNFADTADLVIKLENDTIGLTNSELYVFNTGDLNNDNWDDICFVFNTRVHLLYGGILGDNAIDLTFPRTAAYVAPAGDINGDHQNDLVMGAGRSNNGEIDIYLAGDEFDANIDFTISRTDLPPLFIERIGWRVESAGDFNGDGYDDVIFSCRNFAFGDPHDVFILKGSPNIVTDIKELDYKQLPDKFELKQNYPNPFNSSTIIEFELPKLDYVKIVIYNISGQIINTLYNGKLSAGKHSISWNGRDLQNQEVSSGVYFYKVECNSFSLSKKMVLLK